MTTTPAPQLPVNPGLSSLNQVVLNPFFQEHFDKGIRSCIGSGCYSTRMKAEFHEFLALAQLSKKIEPLAASFEGTFQLHFILQSPLPVRDADGNVEIFDWAHLHLSYPERAVRQPQPGTGFVQIVVPDRVFLPNVSPTLPGLPSQVLCLGPTLPAGIRLREIILKTRDALTLNSVQKDLLDSAGVMNPEAALWWQQNHPRIPLTREPFLA
ncbi:MAG: hypothetical protein HKN23_07490 [Verrucomicrobiales bacterium]|nr:hypothetical protein [Verrucomicrobiales bacterium]